MPKKPARLRKELPTEGLKQEIQYFSDESGNPISVIVPVESWREIESEKETAYLLKSENMRHRLLEAKQRQTGIPFEEAREKLGKSRLKRFASLPPALHA